MTSDRKGRKTLSAEENIKRLASDAFKDHQIKELHNDGLYRHYRCSKPDRCEYAFHVVTFPGRLIIAGDVGDLIVERTADMFVWAKQSVNSIGYFAEKVPQSIPTKEFCKDRAKEAVLEQVKEMREELDDAFNVTEMKAKIAELEELASETDSLEEHEFCSRYFDITNDFEINVRDYNSNFLWCRECVIWFFANWNTDSNSKGTP